MPGVTILLATAAGVGAYYWYTGKPEKEKKASPAPITYANQASYLDSLDVKGHFTYQIILPNGETYKVPYIDPKIRV